MTLAFGVLVASLMGSVHCAGMCGAFVCFYTAGGRGRSDTTGHIAYNLGRLVSYLTLGAVAGLVGASVDRVGALAGLSRVAAVLSGTLMVAWGLSTLLATRGVRLPGFGQPLPGGAKNPLGRVLARVRDRSPVVRAAATGLLTTLLPCGWLYAFVAAAAGSGSVTRAMTTMLLFWAGTLPMMLTAGYGVQRLTGRFRTRLPMLTATAVVVMGLLSISGKMRAAPQALQRMAGAPADASPPVMSHGHH
jgi:sulfite exporter TauE/SafE